MWKFIEEEVYFYLKGGWVHECHIDWLYGETK